MANTASDKTNSRKWLKRGAVIAAALFALYLVLGFWLVPVVIEAQLPKKASELSGRDVTLESARFNPLTFHARLYGLAVSDPATGELITIDAISANYQPTALLRHRLELRRLAINGVDAHVAIDASGGLNVQDLLDLAAQDSGAEAEDPDDEPYGIRVRELLLEAVALHFSDRSLAAPYEETLALSAFHGRDLGTVAKEPPAADSAAPAEPFLQWDFDGAATTSSGGSIALRGGATSIEPWAFTVSFDLSGFPLASLNPYVGESVVAEIAGAFGLSIQANVALPDEGEPLATLSGSMGVSDFELRDSAQTYASFDAFQIGAFALDSATFALDVSEAYFDGLSGSAALQRDGSLVMPQFKSTDSEPNPPPAAPGDWPALTISIRDSGIRQATLALRDESAPQPFSATISALDLLIEQLQIQAAPEAIDGAGRLRTSLSVLDGTFASEIELLSLRNQSATVAARWDGIAFAPLQPYVAAFADAKLSSGIASGNADIVIDGIDNLQATSSSRVESLTLLDPNDQRPLASFAGFEVNNAAYGPEGIDIESVAIEQPYLRAWRDDTGINWLRVLRIASEPTAGEGEEAVGTSAADTAPLAIAVGEFTIANGSADFDDHSIYSPHSTRLTDLSVELANVSTEPDTLTEYAVSAVVDGSARVAVKGSVNAFDPQRHMDLALQVNGYDMRSISPYWEEYLARGLAKGQFRLDTSMSVRESQMNASSDVLIDQLTLGEKVPHEDAPLKSLPVGLAIGLMKDASGEISFNDFKVGGDLSDPEVNYMSIVFRALRNLVVKAAASPFSFLGGLVGGREDLDTIAFAPGESALDAEAADKASALAKILELRPLLKLEISAQTDEAAEIRELRLRLLAQQLLQPESTPAGGHELPPTYDAMAFETAVETAYDATHANLEPTAAGSGEAAQSPADHESISAEDDPNLLTRLARFVGLKRRPEADGKSAAASETDSEADEQAPAATEAQVEVPLEEKIESLLSQIPPESVPSEWIQRIERERGIALKQSLIAAGVDPGRIFVTDARATSVDGSRIQLQLTE